MARLEHRVHELTVGQLAERSGVAVSALHFYESKGLIGSRRTATTSAASPATRSAGSRSSGVAARRDPARRHPRRARHPPEERTPTVADWARLSETWRSDLDARIRQLERLRDDLTDCIGCGCLSIGKCALANPTTGSATKARGRVLLTERTAAPAGAAADAVPRSARTSAPRG